MFFFVEPITFDRVVAGRPGSADRNIFRCSIHPWARIGKRTTWRRQRKIWPKSPVFCGKKEIRHVTRLGLFGTFLAMALSPSGRG